MTYPPFYPPTYPRGEQSMADDDIVLINIPAPGDPSAIEVVGPGDGSIAVPSIGLERAAVQDMIDDSLDVHVAAPTPHPAYDDIPSLRLLFENGLV